MQIHVLLCVLRETQCENATNGFIHLREVLVKRIPLPSFAP